MRKIIFFLAIFNFSSPVLAGGYPDGSGMGTPAMAKCAAAALKIEMKLWQKWYDALHTRYSIMHKGKKSPKQVESYTLERVMDKKEALNRIGIDSKRAYKNYFNQNCKGEI